MAALIKAVVPLVPPAVAAEIDDYVPWEMPWRAHINDVISRPVFVKSAEVDSSRFYTVRGSGSAPEGKFLYVVVEVKNGGLYPQGRPLEDSDGSWSCDIALGSVDERDAGEYSVFLVAAEPAQRDPLNSYIRDQLRSDSFGIGPRLPGDLEIYGRATTVKREPSENPYIRKDGLKLSDNLRLSPVACVNPYASTATEEHAAN